ncbi:hypothetical protein B9T25_03155 [Acinetobacter sp. ANC 4470]|uniref:hypothetical protein n=1 Tax=Acinetobacter sp. ANC 4470 TaxID=1977881 RepID=UPI000A33F64E|nr:hypothetical protein [Acinetobacter sp. ANC 4470]OTG69578.1 hypothetical protein B9T25_03155 [Acinetobacter sp. ANC 4470]
MTSELVKLKRRKDAKSKLKEINQKRENYYLIHYSCESFYDIKDGRTPRITSIAIRSFDSAQTHSFSIHKTAEQKKIGFEKISEYYDELEKGMLKEYFEYLTTNKGSYYIHWNMRDINYGFQAIEHRFKVLGGKPYLVDDDRKIDLARLLISFYGVRYTSHGDHGRLHSICELNKIKGKDMLNGKEEALAFNTKDFIKLHQSTLRKVDIMSNLLERVQDGTLITQARWSDKYGFHPKIFVELITQHWIWSAIVIVGVIVGIISPFIL